MTASASLLITMSVNAGLSVPPRNSGESFSLTSDACGDHSERHSWLLLFSLWHQVRQQAPSLTSDFLHQRKQIRSLFLTNRSELSFSCLHPPKKKRAESPMHFIAHITHKRRHLGAIDNDSPVAMLTSRPDTMVISMPKTAR